MLLNFFFLISSRLFKVTFKINLPIFEVAKFREPKDGECKLESRWQGSEIPVKEWKLEAVEAARLKLSLQANLVEMLSCLWVHIHVPAVFCLGVFGQGLSWLRTVCVLNLVLAGGVQSWVVPFGQVLRTT